VTGVASAACEAPCPRLGFGFVLFLTAITTNVSTFPTQTLIHRTEHPSLTQSTVIPRAARDIDFQY
jgi:hypothetical protein